MIFLVIFLCGVIVAVAFGGLAAWSDLRGMTIPNSCSLGIAGAFILAFTACALAGQGDVFQSLPSHLAAAGSVFAVTFVMCLFKLMGGGDSKLLTAYALWAGVHYITTLLFVMALAGFILAVLAIGVRQVKPFKAPKEGGWIARAQAGQSVIPYGIPIAIGAVAVFYYGGFFLPETLLNFLKPPG